MDTNEIKFVTVKDIPNKQSKNYRYNEAIRPLVLKIFDANVNNRATHYLKSTNNNIAFNNFKAQALGSKHANLSNYTDPLDNRFTNTHLLGPLEQGFINFLLLADNDLVVLKGYLGTGKTELINYVSRFMIENKRHDNCPCRDKCSAHRVAHVMVDVNKFINIGSDTSKFLQNFSTLLFGNIATEFRRLIIKNGTMDSLVNYCTEENVPNLAFLKTHLKFNVPEWTNYSEKDKYDYVLLWIKQQYEANNIEIAVDMLCEILKFYKQQYPIEKNCFALIIDNIDKLEIPAQNEVVGLAKAINRKAEMLVIIPVRLTTFYKIKAYASDSFNVCDNMGLPPVNLCLARMKHYMDHKDDEYYKCAVDSEYLDMFNQRILYIYSVLTEKKEKKEKNDRYLYDRLYKTLEALAGVSIRRGQRIFKRLFLNYTVDYEDNLPSEDLLIRSLYSYENESGKMNTREDKRLHNIYQDTDTMSCTLHNLRILNTIKYCEQNSIPIKVKDLKSVLCLYEDIDEKQVQSLLKVLWKQRKRIITMKDVGSNETWEIKNDASIEMTKAAYGYLEYLSSDLQYLQSCLECIDLNERIVKNYTDTVLYYIPEDMGETYKLFMIRSIQEMENARYIDFLPLAIDYSDIFDRFKFIRTMLRIVYKKDVIETVNYIHNIKRQNSEIKGMSKISNIVSIPIVKGVAYSVLNILKSMEESASSLVKARVYAERADWESDITLVESWNTSLFPSSDYNTDLTKLIRRY
jgi:hypothetical protein